MASVLVGCATALAAPLPARVLRVCADPNNLPFSNDRLEGFENRLVALIGDAIDARVEYTWRAQRRGFVRETVKAGACDLVPGLPTRTEGLLMSRPYYRSSYVFVSRADRHLDVAGLDDPALRHLRIGVQLVGADGTNTPPVQALAQRHLAGNLVGFTLYGDYATPNPPARIVEAVARSEVDLALVWGPLAGYFARLQRVPLSVVPIAAGADHGLPMAYDISVGIASARPDLLEMVNRVLATRRAAVSRLMHDFGVPDGRGGRRAD